MAIQSIATTVDPVNTEYEMSKRRTNTPSLGGGSNKSNKTSTVDKILGYAGTALDLYNKYEMGAAQALKQETEQLEQEKKKLELESKRSQVLLESQRTEEDAAYAQNFSAALKEQDANKVYTLLMSNLAVSRRNPELTKSAIGFIGQHGGDVEHLQAIFDPDQWNRKDVLNMQMDSKQKNIELANSYRATKIQDPDTKRRQKEYEVYVGQANDFSSIMNSSSHVDALTKFTNGSSDLSSVFSNTDNTVDLLNIKDIQLLRKQLSGDPTMEVSDSTREFMDEEQKLNPQTGSNTDTDIKQLQAQLFNQKTPTEKETDPIVGLMRIVNVKDKAVVPLRKKEFDLASQLLAYNNRLRDIKRLAQGKQQNDILDHIATKFNSSNDSNYNNASQITSQPTPQTVTPTNTTQTDTNKDNPFVQSISNILDNKTASLDENEAAVKTLINSAAQNLVEKAKTSENLQKKLQEFRDTYPKYTSLPDKLVFAIILNKELRTELKNRGYKDTDTTIENELKNTISNE